MVAAQGHVGVWTDPETGRDLVPLDQLLALAREDGRDDLPLVLRQFMRAGAELLLGTIGSREVPLVRMPGGWRAGYRPR